MTYFRLQFLLEFCISVRYPDISTYQWDKICILVRPSIVINVEDATEEARKAGKGQEEDS